MNPADFLRACRDDPTFAIEKVLKIRSEDGSVLPFTLNRAQKILAKTRADLIRQGKPVRIIVLKARRHGVSTWEQALNFVRVWLYPNQQVTTLAHSLDSSKRIFRICEFFYQHLPQSLRPRRLTERSARSLDFVTLNSLLYVGTAGATGFARGDTLQRVHWSEVALSKGDIDEQRSLLVGLTEAAREGEIVLESTANGTGDLFHETWLDAQDPKSAWTPIFLPWWFDDRNRSAVSPDEDTDILESRTEEERALPLDATQLAWRRAKRREPQFSEGLWLQEYAESAETCFIVVGSPFFRPEIMLKILEAIPDPAQVEDGGDLEVYLPPGDEEWVIGADPSEGNPDSNPAVATVISTDGRRQAATLSGRWGPIEFAKKVAKLGARYNTALLAVERNNHGHSMLNTLVNKVDYPNLYRHEDYDHERGSTVHVLGWPTTEGSRQQMLDEFREAIQSGRFVPGDRRLVRECLRFVRTKGGKYEAGRGADDDRIVSVSVAIQACGSVMPEDAEAVGKDSSGINAEFGTLDAAFGPGDF